jgi:uncharacterized protein (DUF1015 family)
MSTYIVGQVVGILCSGSWSTNTQGKFTVTKVNKVRVELARISDGYVRVFSVKTGKELSDFKSNTWIVSEAQYDAEVAAKEMTRAREGSIAAIKTAANQLGRYSVSKADLAAIRALLDEAEQFAFNE